MERERSFTVRPCAIEAMGLWEIVLCLVQNGDMLHFALQHPQSASEVKFSRFPSNPLFFFAHVASRPHEGILHETCNGCCPRHHFGLVPLPYLIFNIATVGRIWGLISFDWVSNSQMSLLRPSKSSMIRLLTSCLRWDRTGEPNIQSRPPTTYRHESARETCRSG